VTDSLLGLLKLCLLALLYLFFLRVLWAVWSEVRGPRVATVPEGATRRAVKVKPSRRRREVVSRLTVAEPKSRRGAVYQLGPELTMGRAGGCGLALVDDTYVSNIHARVFQRDGRTFVEDLGSTNGTYLNGERVVSPVPMRRGDRLQVGATVLEAG